MTDNRLPHAPPRTSPSWAAPPACPICGATRGRRLFEVRGFHLWRCRRCGVRAFHPRPVEDPGDLYNADYFAGRKEGIGYGDYLGGDHWYGPRVFGEIRERLLAAFPERGRLLDLGCAAGHLVEAAAADGWNAAGVDPGAAMVEHGRRRGLDLRAGTLRDAGFPDATFDVIVSLHTVEHLLDPLGDLRELRRIARPGAQLVVEVPNAASLGALIRRRRWSQLKPPEHLNFFDRHCLARLLLAAGWRPLEWRTVSLGGEVSAAVAAGGRRGVAPLARALGTVADRAGLWRVVEALGFGGNLRMFATAGSAPEEHRRG